MNSFWLPIIYAFVCASAMAIFLFVYKRFTQNKRLLKPWFPPHKARDAYVSLLNANPPAPELHLKSALLLRAMEDVRRLSNLQANKGPLQTMVQQGLLGDEMGKRYQVAEQEVLGELQEVVNEAETYRQGWGQFIIQTAAQMVEYEKQKEMVAEMKVKREQEEKDQKLREERDERESKDREEREKIKKERDRIRAEEELLKAEEKEKEKDISIKKRKPHKKK